MALLVGQGPVGLPGSNTSNVFSQTSGNPGPGFPLRPGTRAADQDGNVYVFVDYVGTVITLQPVQINADYTAQAIGATGRGPVGVAMTGASSDQGGWVMIYGRTRCIIGMGGVSPSDAANGPTTLSTSAQTQFVLATSLTSPAGIGWVSDSSLIAPNGSVSWVIRGMSVAQDTSMGDVSVSDFCSLTSVSVCGVCGVFLNYPHIDYIGALSS